jgi:hypothetical protein
MRNFRTISGSDDKKDNIQKVETWIRSPSLLDDPYLNKGIVFTMEERKMFVFYYNTIAGN